MPLLNSILSHSITRQACRPCFIEGTASIEFLRKRKSEANSESSTQNYLCLTVALEGQRARNQRFAGGAKRLCSTPGLPCVQHTYDFSGATEKLDVKTLSNRILAGKDRPYKFESCTTWS